MERKNYQKSELIDQINKVYNDHCGKDIPEKQAIRFAYEMAEYMLLVFGEIPPKVQDVIFVHFEEMFKRALRNNTK